MGPGADEKRVADCCAGSLDHFDWLVKCGCRSRPSSSSNPVGNRWATRAWPTAAVNSYPFDTIADPAPREHVPQMQNKKQGFAGAATC